jgi:hypothetical protein
VGLSEGLDGSVFDGRFEITAASDGHVVIHASLIVVPGDVPT